MSVWPVGYFRATTSWLLRNRKAVSARVGAIDAEVERIGFVTVAYKLTTEDGETKATEERIGFSVTEGSSLGRLCQAYVANGGNPLDISPFMHPDSTEIVSEDADGGVKVHRVYPHGGIVAPISTDYNDPIAVEGKETGYGSYRGGWVDADSYYPARQGGRQDRGNFDSNSVVRYMHQIRSWANQEIKERLQDIEWQIIKLCDLREQLEKERDEVLVQAFGGALSGVSEFDSNRFSPDLRMQVLIQDMYEMLYETDNDGEVIAFRANQGKVPFLEFTFPDVSSENRDPMGG